MLALLPMLRPTGGKIFRFKSVPSMNASFLMKRHILAVILGITLASNASADTQNISLVAGWNAIAFQVVPSNASPDSVFASLGANFVEAYTFNNQSKKFFAYRNTSLGNNPNTLPAAAMGPIQLGSGYLVKVQSATSWAVTGAAPGPISVTITSGMNLIGPVLPAGTAAPVGLQDILSGPLYHFPTAVELASAGYSAFSNNNVSDDKTYVFTPGRAYWVESSGSDPQSVMLSVASKPPLVYLERSEPYVVEAPITGFGGTSLVNVPVKMTRNFSGRVGFLVTGTAHPNTDFAITGITTAVTPTNSIGEITVNSATTSSYLIPVVVKEKTRLQTNSSVFITLQRPVEVPAAQDSGTLPQVAHIQITDGMRGVYEGLFKGTSATATLNGQLFRVALRENGQAIFDPADGGMISGRFALAYTLSNGVPQFTGSTSVTLASSDALGRNVGLTVTPSATVALPEAGNPTPAFDLPLTLTFTNLSATGPFQTTAKLTLTQANPAL